MITKRTSVVDIKKRKKGEPIVCLTAYSAPFAKILDEHADLLLVGDSVGMVLYGMESTLPVTVDMMINHGLAVMRGSKKACVIVDMPFGSYQASVSQAFENAAKIISLTGCQGVKLEGGTEMTDTINFLVQRGIPVMGHVGLMPQRVNAYGGYSCRGKTKEGREKIMQDAIAVQNAGAFSVVIEGVIEQLAADVAKELEIPVIGIGGSAQCDGQILVSEDMSGLFQDFKPKFVKRFGNVAEELEKAAKAYSKEVKSGKFPAKENCF
ncbi:MAG: 3-methyl-2-oxobutanoate hydroxymethyltransferase [Alphaproteobacteria bacterium CG11_big_fil_rev_8_21_14_0_20_39_49]|nr:MAG: 3-methyl-2-oxobutanoate hydroxymethyltransferase [Alphaproteobacteria bacterium CG11_big_fil_rev_8_21_14_0_20_39_49]